MKNKVNIIILLVSILLIIYVSLYGIKIGNFEILSISRLRDKDSALKQKIEDATVLTSQDYPESIKKFEETFEKHNIKKQKYEELVQTVNANNKEIYETKQYEIGYLWRLLGAYATEKKFEGDEGISLALDVKKGSLGKSMYDFNFTVKGSYTRISQFITDIENDSDLYFRIYNFKMSGNGEEITATFSVKNINIDPSTIK